MRVMEVVPPAGGAVDASKIEVYHHRESQSHLVYLLQFLVCSYFHLYEFADSGYLQWVLLTTPSDLKKQSLIYLLSNLYDRILDIR